MRAHVLRPPPHPLPPRVFVCVCSRAREREGRMERGVGGGRWGGERERARESEFARVHANGTSGALASRHGVSTHDTQTTHTTLPEARRKRRGCARAHTHTHTQTHTCPRPGAKRREQRSAGR